MSDTSYPIPTAPIRPDINVLLVSFLLFFAYLLLTAIVSLSLSMWGNALHPATRIFVWLVLAISIGYGLLRRYGRYPRRSRLAAVLVLSIVLLLMMSISVLLRVADRPILTYWLDLSLNSILLFVVGALGFWIAGRLFHRWAPTS